jgi:hypothetical protein
VKNTLHFPVEGADAPIDPARPELRSVLCCPSATKYIDETFDYKSYNRQFTNIYKYTPQQQQIRGRFTRDRDKVNCVQCRRKMDTTLVETRSRRDKAHFVRYQMGQVLQEIEERKSKLLELEQKLAELTEET